METLEHEKIPVLPQEPTPSVIHRYHNPHCESPALKSCLLKVRLSIEAIHVVRQRLPHYDAKGILEPLPKDAKALYYQEGLLEDGERV